MWKAPATFTDSLYLLPLNGWLLHPYEAGEPVDEIATIAVTMAAYLESRKRVEAHFLDTYPIMVFSHT